MSMSFSEGKKAVRMRRARMAGHLTLMPPDCRSQEGMNVATAISRQFSLDARVTKSQEIESRVHRVTR